MNEGVSMIPCCASHLFTHAMAQAPRTARTRKFNANLARFFNIIIPRTSTQLPAMIQNDVSDISCMAFPPHFFLYL